MAIANLERLTGDVNDSVQISLYLHDHIDDAEGRKLAAEIKTWEGVGTTEYISQEQALVSFQSTSGFGEVISNLPKNPLPAVVTLTISKQSLTASTAKEIELRTKELNSVAQVKFDLSWLKKVQSVTNFIHQAVTGLSVLLAIGVVLVVGNTIKLSIDSRKEEIVVTKLVGGTNAFIRRPFLYMGLLFGAGSAIIALLLLSMGMLVLTSSIADISGAYGSQFKLNGLGVINSISLLIGCAGLGWLGAWLASAQHIRALEPR